MTSRARAAVLTSPHSVELREFPLPEVSNHDGLLRVEVCGICGSDIPVYEGNASPELYRMPLILGHEIVGRVERVGRDASSRWLVSEGDRVVVERWLPCGSCDRCLSGYYRLCLPRLDGYPMFYGGTSTAVPPSLWGGFADYVYLHPRSVIYRIRGDVPPQQAVLYTPLANAICWVSRHGCAGVGSNVAILGPGQEGLAAILAAREVGAQNIIVAGLSSDRERLAIARRLGATVTVNVDKDDVISVVKEVTDGRMADVVLEVTSSRTMQPLELALQIVGFKGRVVVAGVERGAIDLDSLSLMRRLVSVHWVWGRDRGSMKAAIRLIESKKYEAELNLISTHCFRLEQIGAALAMLASRSDPSVVHVSVVP